MITQSSLWGDEITINSSKDTDNILNKISSVKSVKDDSVEKTIKSKSVSTNFKIDLISQQVKKILGKFADQTEVITDADEFKRYIDSAISVGEIAIDTETNNTLDYLNCKLMGLCLYVPGEKSAYVPINHVNKYTGEKLANQLTEEDVKRELDRLGNTKVIMHNGKFDYQVLKCTCDCTLNIDWDTMVCTRMIDENELDASLKYQYADKVDPSIGKYSIDKLFSGLPYAWFSPDIFSLYSATDSYMTEKLKDWQFKELTKDGNEGVLRLFNNVESPLVPVVANMELCGVCFDLEYSKRLKVKYESKFKELDRKLNDEISKYRDRIKEWKQSKDGKSRVGKKTKASQLTDPLNLDSPTQLAILLYDILRAPKVNDDKPRSVDKEALKALYKDHNISICETILERKKTKTLLDDFILKLPTLVNPKDGKIHCNFNQCGREEKGVVTGRFSSSEPNMQQIPSKNKELRMMFCASKGYKMVGGDYSAQEPRLATYYSGDKDMLQAYLDKKDLYSVIAQSIYNNEYEDNLEFYPEGKEIIHEGKKVICGYKTHKNEEGAKRRSAAKSVLLGLLYGRGAYSIGEQTGKSYEESKELIEKFFATYPVVKKWIDDTHEKARKYEYVEDWYGRRRRLPNINLPEFEVNFKSSHGNFNPILRTKGVYSVDSTLIQKYKDLCKNAKRRDLDKIIRDADREGIYIKSNSDLIAEAERQSVNSIVQGGAATLTKMAMLNIYRDKELNDLGFRMLITVHDEILGECPEENAEKASERLATVMKDTAKPYMNVPMEVDTYVVNRWYEDEYAAVVNDEFKSLCEGDPKKGVSPLSKEEAFRKIAEERIESSEEELKKILGIN